MNTPTHTNSFPSFGCIRMVLQGAILVITIFSLSHLAAAEDKAPVELASTSSKIVSIDTYGLHTVTNESVIEAAGLQVGDEPPSRKQVRQIIKRLQSVPHVQQADVAIIRVGGPNGGPPQPVIFIGILETGRPSITYHEKPTREMELPLEIIQTYRESEHAMIAAFQKGIVQDDHSEGHALIGDEAAREIQRKLVPLADQHYNQIVQVLRNAKDADQRRTAAWVIAYSHDKKQVAAELVVATQDPDGVVRNNAMRGLGVILAYAKAHPELALQVPIDPFVEMLESLDWTDRNKALFVLDGLTDGKDAASLAQLREKSVPTLAEMSRWKSEGHAMMPFQLVGRIAGLSNEEILKAWQAGEQELVIDRALKIASKK